MSRWFNILRNVSRIKPLTSPGIPSPFYFFHLCTYFKWKSCFLEKIRTQSQRYFLKGIWYNKYTVENNRQSPRPSSNGVIDLDFSWSAHTGSMTSRHDTATLASWCWSLCGSSLVWVALTHNRPIRVASGKTKKLTRPRVTVSMWVTDGSLG